MRTMPALGELLVGQSEERLVRRRIKACDSVGHAIAFVPAAPTRLASAGLRSNRKQALHRRAPLARGRANPWGRAGLSPFQRPVFRIGATFQFLELFARGDIRRHSGQLSRALRVRAVRPRPRPAADRRGRQQPRCARARRCSIRRISPSWSTSPLVGRDEAGKAFAALGAAARPRPDHRQLPRRARPQRPQERAARRSSAPSAASPPSIAARPPPKSSPPVRSNDDQIAALKAAAPRPRRPRRHHRRHASIPTSSAGSSSSWAASRSTPRSAPNSTDSLRR